MLRIYFHIVFIQLLLNYIKLHINQTHQLFKLNLLMNYSHGPAFSLSKSQKKTIDQMHQYNPIVPGPIYQVSGKGRAQPNLLYSVGKSSRAEINHGIEQTPSPMHYSPKKIQKSVEKTIPKSNPQQKINENPDPSCYITNQKHTTKNVLAYTLTSRQPSIIQNPHNKNPGPGHYQSQQILPILTRSKNIKQATFGTDSRFKYTFNPNPGVGNYQVTSNQLSSSTYRYSVGKSERSISYKETPGPTDYSKLSFVQQSLRNKVGKTLSGRFGTAFQTDKTTNNAFHKYLQNPEQANVKWKNNPKYSLGKDRRDLFKNNNNPGPSQYINNNFLTKHSSTALMLTSEHSQHNDSIYKPGPGTYQLKKETGITFSFPKSKSLATVSYSDNPGAGRYQPNSNTTVKVNSFAKSKRFAQKTANAVGVGEYSIDNNNKSFMKSLSKMSRSQRFKHLPESTPGPGDYHITSVISYKASKDKL